MAVPFQVTFDCADPASQAGFWAQTLGYVVQPPPPGHDSWPEFLGSIGVPESQWGSASAVIDPEGNCPRLYFQRVPEGKTAKNRVHLDVNVGAGLESAERRSRVEAEAERVTALGATEMRRAEEHGEFWIVLTDPEGNEFCLQ